MLWFKYETINSNLTYRIAVGTFTDEPQSAMPMLHALRRGLLPHHQDWLEDHRTPTNHCMHYFRFHLVLLVLPESSQGTGRQEWAMAAKRGHWLLRTRWKHERLLWRCTNLKTMHHDVHNYYRGCHEIWKNDVPSMANWTAKPCCWATNWDNWCKIWTPQAGMESSAPGGQNQDREHSQNQKIVV